MFELIYRYDPAHPVERQQPGDAHDACRRLEEGNRAFSNRATGTEHGSHVVYFDLEDIGIAAASSFPKQQPFAMVLGCSDARVPTELIFDCACNELFVVRVAGNILGQEQLGSIDYAVTHLSQNLKLLVVLGHGKCGAVTAAVDAFLVPADYLGLLSSHHLRAIINSLFPAVRGAARSLAIQWGEQVVTRPGYRAALIECSIIFNAALTASILREDFGDANPHLRIVFGVYDLSTRRVQVPGASSAGDDATSRLVDAPYNKDTFRQFAAQVVASPLIRGLLEQ